MKYQVEITETLQRIITIDATDLNTAINEAKRLYDNEDIVLDSNDYIDTEFKTVLS